MCALLNNDYLIPFAEGSVGGEDHAAVLVSAGDDLEEEPAV
jgi:hypothetical protein